MAMLAVKGSRREEEVDEEELVLPERRRRNVGEKVLPTTGARRWSDWGARHAKHT